VVRLSETELHIPPAAAPDPRSPFARVPYDELLTCIRCGFCLPTCPTYVSTGLETASPRGRLALIKAAAEGQLPADGRFAHEMFFCLECRACETACPAGVPFAHIMEATREVLHAHGLSPATRSPLGAFALRHLLPRRNRLRRLAALLGLAQRLGLVALAARSGLLPPILAEQAVALPPAPRRRGLRSHYPPVGPRRARVALFVGCVMDALFPATHDATARLLARAGAEVIVVAGQTCCGALHAHAGDRDGALALARANIAAFEACPADFVVNNAGGCGAMLRGYAQLLADADPDPAWRERAAAFAARCRDASEVLAELWPEGPIGELDADVTVQDSCHLVHAQRVRAAPRSLLRRVRGLRLHELAGADTCCGSAGIYNLTNADDSARILDRKMAAVAATGARLVVTTNPGCLIQMRWGIVRAGLAGRVEAVHLLDVLARAAGV
jgi:glycolate oxidase iron-sulfur subunit